MSRITKERAFNMVADHLRELTYKQRMRHDFSAQRIAALVGLSELLLILYLLVISVSGWTPLGIIICSMIVGSFVTNMIWLVFMRKDLWMMTGE